MSRIIAVANAKGGVGKTTTAVNLSAALAEAGHRVLAIDLDPQSSLTLSLGMNPLRVPGTICNLLSPGSDFLNAPIIHLQEQWDLVPANEELRALEHELDSDPKKIYTIGAGLHPFKDVYDFIILDCAASMGVLTGAALAAADSVIIPLTPDFLAFQVSAILFRIIRRVQETINPNLQIAGIFLTMYDTRTKHAREILTHIRKTYGASVPFFSAVIYQSVKLKEAPSLGQSVLKYAPQSQAARAYRVVARELVEGAPKAKRPQDKVKKNGAQPPATAPAGANGKAKPQVKAKTPALIAVEPTLVAEPQPIAPAKDKPIAESVALAAQVPTFEPISAETPIEAAPASDELTTDDSLEENPLPIFEIYNDPPIDHHLSEVIPVAQESAPSAETAPIEKAAKAVAEKESGANGFKGKFVNFVGKMRTAVPKPNTTVSTETVSGLFKKLRERGRQNNDQSVQVAPTQSEEAVAEAIPAALETTAAVAESVETPVAVAGSITTEAVVALQEPVSTESGSQVGTPSAEIQAENIQAVAEQPIKETTVTEIEIPPAELTTDKAHELADEQEVLKDSEPIAIITTTLEFVTEEPASRDDELDADGREANDTEADESFAPVAVLETAVVEPTLALVPSDVLPQEATFKEPQAEVVGLPFDASRGASNASAAPAVPEPAAPVELPRPLKPSEIWSLPYIPPSQREPATLSVVGSDVILGGEQEAEPTIQELLRRVSILTSQVPAQDTEVEPEDEEPDFEKLSQELFGAEPDSYTGTELMIPPVQALTTKTALTETNEIVSVAQVVENPIAAYRAAEIARDDVEAWIRRAESSDAPWEALAAWLHVLEINPLNGYARTRMEEMIRAWLETATRDDADELTKLGNSLVQAGQRAPADETFRRVIELNPRAHRAWLGRALVTQNPLDRLVYVQRGLELAPGDPEVRRALAEARDQLNAEASRLLEEGLHLAHSGRTAQAHLLFKHAIELAPLDDRAWLGCARTADNLPSKLSYLKQALQINPANTEAQDLYRILTNFMGTGKKERWSVVPEDPRVIYFALGLLMLLAALIAIPLFVIH